VGVWEEGDGGVGLGWIWVGWWVFVFMLAYNDFVQRPLWAGRGLEGQGGASHYKANELAYCNMKNISLKENSYPFTQCFKNQ
jgi:hypothetical protein